MVATAELDQLLNEAARHNVCREPLRPAVLLGAGHLGRSILAGLRKAGVEPEAFADDTPSKIGTCIDGLPVLSPKDAATRYSHADWVVTILNPQHRYQDSWRRLQELGCRSVSSFLHLAWDYPDSLLPYYQFDLPAKVVKYSERIYAAHALLRDPRSRQQFYNHLQFRLRLDYSALPSTTPNQYFASGIVPRLADDITFVDCGAYTGDTLAQFIARQGGKFRRAFAIEPDQRNFEQLTQYVQGLDPNVARRIELQHVAVGACTSIAKFNGLGNMSAGVDKSGTEQVIVRPLDELVGMEGPMFIKFDIEGGEYDAILGCRRLLREVEPLLAISVYHRPSDLWEIPLLLQSINPHYRFHLSTEGTDGMDVVCYAVPQRMAAAQEAA